MKGRFLLPLFLLTLGCCCGAADSLPPLAHMGRPLLPAETLNIPGITIIQAPYPPQAKGEITSSDGHRCLLDDYIGGAGHTNDAVLFFHCPHGSELKLEFKPTYWETSQYRWVNEDLLFVRIWWGRHWGSDYIFDADTAKLVYQEGFSEPMKLSP